MDHFIARGELLHSARGADPLHLQRGVQQRGPGHGGAEPRPPLQLRLLPRQLLLRLPPGLGRGGAARRDAVGPGGGRRLFEKNISQKYLQPVDLGEEGRERLQAIKCRAGPSWELSC